MRLLVLALCLVWMPISSMAGSIKVQSFPGEVTITVDPWAEGKKADLLFVIDDSGSMGIYQNSLASAAGRLAQDLSAGGYNLHAAVLNSSNDSKYARGPFTGPYLSSENTPDFGALLQQSLKVGTDGAPFEEPLLSLQKGLFANAPEMDGFLRGDSHLAIVLLTDAEDQSEIKSADLIAQIRTLSHARRGKVSLVAGMVTPTNPLKCEQDERSPAVKLNEFVDGLNGVKVEICSPNLGEEISRALVAQLGLATEPNDIREIQLPSEAVVESIKVTYGNAQLPAGDVNFGWTYDRTTNVLRVGAQFDYASQPTGTKLVIHYKPVTWN